MNGTALLVLAALTAGVVIGRLSAGRWSGPVEVEPAFQDRPHVLRFVDGPADRRRPTDVSWLRFGDQR